MAQVHMAPNTPTKWWLLGTLAVGAVALIAWSRGRHEAPAEPVVAAAPESQAVPAAPVVQAASAVAPAVLDAATVTQQQAQAAKEIERQPEMKPIEGPITERPSFVSEMEWMMLKGTAQQNPQPDVELTRLVNFLRFTKQLELWEGLPRSADAGRRQALAAQLLDDLPSRVSHGEMDLKAAQQTQAALLKDVVADPQARKQRAAVEAKRLMAASEAK